MSDSKEFSQGWPVIVAAALGIGLGLSPLPFYTIDVMVEPLSSEFGWTRGEVYSSIAIVSVSGLFMAPLIGFLTERFSARLVSIASLIAFGLAMMGLSLNNGSKPVYYMLWFFVALSGAGTLPIVLTRPINNWFDKQRGLALGLALITTGVFGALAKSYAQAIVDDYGWRVAYLALGALPLSIALPFAILSLRDVHDLSYKNSTAATLKYPLLGIALLGGAVLVYYAFDFVMPLFQSNGLRLQYAMAFAFMAMVLIALLAAFVLPIKMDKAPAITQGKSGELPGLTFAETLKTWRFWLLAICFVPISYAIGAMIPSIVPLLTTKGYAIGEAVSLATLTGLAVFFGRLIGGYMIDKIWAPAVAFVFLSLPGVALLLFVGDISQTGAVIAILMIGFGAGVEYDFMAYLVSKYFGMKRYSAIYGALYAFFAAGAGFGPTIMNNLADSRGWDFTLQSAAIALFIATIPLLFLGRYRRFD